MVHTICGESLQEATRAHYEERNKVLIEIKVILQLQEVGTNEFDTEWSRNKRIILLPSSRLFIYNTKNYFQRVILGTLRQRNTS